MKTKFLLSILILVVIGTTSCKKKYTCNCDIIANSQSASIDHRTYTLTAKKRDIAKSDCENMFKNATLTISSYTCTLQ